MWENHKEDDKLLLIDQMLITFSYSTAVNVTNNDAKCYILLMYRFNIYLFKFIFLGHLVGIRCRLFDKRR